MTQLTVSLKANETVELTEGKSASYIEWCRSEADRIRKDGRQAEIRFHKHMLVALFVEPKN